jgi:hypothetical protein
VRARLARDGGAALLALHDAEEGEDGVVGGALAVEFKDGNSREAGRDLAVDDGGGTGGLEDPPAILARHGPAAILVGDGRTGRQQQTGQRRSDQGSSPFPFIPAKAGTQILGRTIGQVQHRF